MARILYISYDGIAEPLGQSQVVPYLKKLSDENEIHIISFEKPSDLNAIEKYSALQSELNNAGIIWTSKRYHKWPSVAASIYDIISGQLTALHIAKKMNAEIIHVRSYIPALIALPVKKITGAKLLFDIRGFWADERVDGGIWKADGFIYNNVKRLEKYLFRAADHIVTLTEASVSKIHQFNYWKYSSPNITVIPTCADLERFKPPKKIPTKSTFIFGYVGSFGTWYLIDETLALFSAILKIRPDAKMIIINYNEHEAIRNSTAKAGIPFEKVEITRSTHDEVPFHIQRMHAASALIRPCFSKIASAPTKLAEYLGCAVPCVGNYEVGDMESILEGKGTGVILRSFNNEALLKAAKQIISLANNLHVRKRCRETALAQFSLKSGVKSYRSIYKSIILM